MCVVFDDLLFTKNEKELKKKLRTLGRNERAYTGKTSKQKPHSLLMEDKIDVKLFDYKFSQSTFSSLCVCRYQNKNRSFRQVVNASSINGIRHLIKKHNNNKMHLYRCFYF